MSEVMCKKHDRLSTSDARLWQELFEQVCRDKPEDTTLRQLEEMVVRQKQAEAADKHQKAEGK